MTDNIVHLCFSASTCVVSTSDWPVDSCVPLVSEWGDIIDEMSDRMANQPALIKKFAKEG